MSLRSDRAATFTNSGDEMSRFEVDNGSLILAGDRLPVLSENGDIILADAAPQGYREIARKKLLGGRCWVQPALANGKGVIPEHHRRTRPDRLGDEVVPATAVRGSPFLAHSECRDSTPKVRLRPSLGKRSSNCSTQILASSLLLSLPFLWQTEDFG